MFSKKIIVLLLVLLFTAIGISTATALEPIEQLGKSIFFDQNLSINKNQACAACHGPDVGFTGPDSMINAHGAVYEGSVPNRFGNRKPPSAAYAGDSPILYYDSTANMWVGGMFWDGRATGWTLDDPLAEQAKGPFLNPLEQAIPDKACVVYRVCTATTYPVSFQTVSAGACDIMWPNNVDGVCRKKNGMVNLSPDDRIKVEENYNNIAKSIAAYERSAEVNTFSSKYDDYLTGGALTEQQALGLALFNGNAMCNLCHTSDLVDSKPPLFTDFTYDNLGLPKNPENPFYSEPLFNPLCTNWIDFGLGGFLVTIPDLNKYAYDNYGKFKVPTLRNVARGSCEAGYSPCIIKAYGHNGYFKSLKRIVHFYNTRNTLPVCEPTKKEPLTDKVAEMKGCWPLPELALNMNMTELGDLGLTSEEEDAIVAFLMTLSDGYMPPSTP